MARLKRPHIPLDVRLAVALRQLGDHPDLVVRTVEISREHGSLKWMLDGALKRLLPLLRFDDPPGCRDLLHLDHDPALENRPFNARTGLYTPDANDPRFLLYRTHHNHVIKTLVAGDGAKRSDAAQRRYDKRVAKNRKPKAKAKYAGAPKRGRWGKRKMPSRGFPVFERRL